jgi:carbonic anhydrase
MTAQEVLSKLTAGNQRFVENQLKNVTVDQNTKNELTKGQSPYAIILSCADSRVVPELIFNAGMGELFVVRVAGNVANTSSLASMEYAAAHLGTPVIVVLGHQSCGAVTAAVAGGDNGPNLNHLLGHIAPAIKESSDPDSVDSVIRKNAELTVKAIVRDSEIMTKAVNNGKLTIVPAYYHLDSGKVEFLNS